MTNDSCQVKEGSCRREDRPRGQNESSNNQTKLVKMMPHKLKVNKESKMNII
jgi:hypothetical protein